MWKALARLEERWVRTSDRDVEEVGDGDGGTEGDGEGEVEKYKEKEHCRIIYDMIDVDPTLNLLDSTDARQVRYIDKKKQPQVRWMLQLIRRLVGNNNNDNFESNHGNIEGDCKEGNSIDPPPLYSTPRRHRQQSGRSSKYRRRPFRQASRLATYRC